MSESLDVSAETPPNPESMERFTALREAATRVDGQSAFNDQALTDLAVGKRTLLLVEHTERDRPRTVGAAIFGGTELEFVVDPAYRGRGYGSRMLDELLPLTPPGVLAWSHGDHPAARALASSHGFDAVRTLLQLRLPSITQAPGRAEGPPGDSVQIDTFRVGKDEQEWLDLNARVFASHPEQGKLTMVDLKSREAESWFSPDDFLIARDSANNDRMVGFNWLKVEPRHPETGPDSGEIYAIGVDATHAGRGLGRRLMHAGLARLADRGVTSATLYVEADNEAAVHLYRSLGFVDHTIDVQYRRRR